MEAKTATPLGLASGQRAVAFSGVPCRGGRRAPKKRDQPR
jgi:hypothetical protein